jgi:hypothetical protein
MVSTMSNGNKKAYGVAEYVCDTEDDIKDLPSSGCAPGSAAFVISTGTVYMMNSKGEWVEV